MTLWLHVKQFNKKDNRARTCQVLPGTLELYPSPVRGIEGLFRRWAWQQGSGQAIRI